VNNEKICILLENITRKSFALVPEYSFLQQDISGPKILLWRPVLGPCTRGWISPSERKNHEENYE